MVIPQTTAATRAFRAPRDDGWHQVTPGERVRIHVSSKQTLGAFSIVELIAEAGNGVPMHIHDKEDEHFIVLAGTFHMEVGGKRLDLAAGESIAAPRGIAHAWCNASQAPVHVLVAFSPGGIEDLFRMIGRADRSEIAAIADRYGVRLIGPPLEQTIYSIDKPRQ